MFVCWRRVTILGTLDGETKEETSILAEVKDGIGVGNLNMSKEGHLRTWISHIQFYVLML